MRRRSILSSTCSLIPSRRPERVRQKDLSAARFEQGAVFGTREHTATYNILRPSQEGLHGFTKDEAKKALAFPGRRRLRGIAAQSLSAVLLLAAAGTPKIRVFLKKAVPDDYGDLYIVREKRTREHVTSHLPPDTKGTRG